MKLFTFLLLFSTALFSQNQYPRDYFRSPLDIPLQVSGSFGELRSNHFHSGLDFKTQQREGLNVYAAADGYVSRIKISTWGYGKAIYITHPNGYTTVYGHLQKASPAIEEYIKKKQYAQKSFEVEMFPTAKEFVIKKGDIIAFSGNSGGSGAPHLHFEFRDTKTEKIINPLFFGFDAEIADTKKPTITGLIAYPVGDSAVVNQLSNPSMVSLSLQKDGSYLASKVVAMGKIGFGINAYDMSNGSFNKNGVYKVETFLNGNSYFEYQFEKFAFDEGRYINALIDYPRYKKMDQRFQKLFMKTPYNFSAIKTKAENGIINVEPNLTMNYRIEVSDFNGNKTIVNVPIQYEQQEVAARKEQKTTPYFVKAKNDHNYKKDNVSVFLPANTFYEDLYLDFDVNDGVLHLQDTNTAVHSMLTISFDEPSLPESERLKTFIASVQGKKIGYNSTSRKGNMLSTRTRNLGDFKLAKDTIAPKISAVNFSEGKWLSNQKNIILEISDSLTGIGDYNGYLNGKWILFEYDYKTKRIVHDFADNIVTDGKNELKVIVTDNVGNSTTFETHFFRTAPTQ
ncbi:M23 family metallopeptidase [Flavobacterium sp. '19STA2R22 D10 B1']|uniref:M23 family metallopeptidase n=1 Tax=Flavobacterium aerium TaxID=3037261 RepID=UPI00278C4B8D|nr:M23 family metallopeptidase [Flavobacterium sp. '19STA2R22 D10 B1']